MSGDDCELVRVAASGVHTGCEETAVRRGQVEMEAGGDAGGRVHVAEADGEMCSSGWNATTSTASALAAPASPRLLPSAAP